MADMAEPVSGAKDKFLYMFFFGSPSESISNILSIPVTLKTFDTFSDGETSVMPIPLASAAFLRRIFFYILLNYRCCGDLLSAAKRTADIEAQ